MQGEHPDIPDLYLLDKAEGFQQHAITLARRARRELYLYSTALDHEVYDHDDFNDAVSAVARASRFSDVRLLIRDHRPLVARGHRLLTLAKRLSDTIKLRVLDLEIEDIDMGFMIADDDGLLFKRSDDIHEGFANYNARPEVRQWGDKFQYLWQHGKEHVALQRLSL